LCLRGYHFYGCPYANIFITLNKIYYIPSGKTFAREALEIQPAGHDMEIWILSIIMKWTRPKAG
jgi:hypothetical protein